MQRPSGECRILMHGQAPDVHPQARANDEYQPVREVRQVRKREHESRILEEVPERQQRQRARVAREPDVCSSIAAPCRRRQQRQQ